MDLNQAKEAFELLLHSVRPGATRQFIAWLEDRIEGTPQKCVGLYVLWVLRMYHKYSFLLGRVTSFLLKNTPITEHNNVFLPLFLHGRYLEYHLEAFMNYMN